MLERKKRKPQQQKLMCVNYTTQTLPPAKECLQDLTAKRRPSGTPNPQPRKKVKTCVTKLT